LACHHCALYGHLGTPPAAPYHMCRTRSAPATSAARHCAPLRPTRCRPSCKSC